MMGVKIIPAQIYTGVDKIEISQEADRLVRGTQGKRQSPQHEPKSQDEEHRPKQQQCEQGKWAHITPKGVPSGARSDQGTNGIPSEPSHTIEESGQADTPDHAAR